MPEAIITAQNTARKLVESRIGELKLRKNLAGQYNHGDIMTLKKSTKHVLGSQWNALTPGKGVKILLEEEQNVLTKNQRDNLIDTNSVLKKSKKEAVTINTEAPTDATPVTLKITTRVDTKSKVDRQTIARQAAIGTKEVTAACISKHVGIKVTNNFLQEADGNTKKVNEWQLHKIVTKMIATTDRLATTSVLDKLIKIMQ